MKTNTHKFISIVLLLSVLITLPVFSGRGDKSGTSASPMLLIPVGGREIAMGGSSIATTKGIEAIFFNPAGLSFGRNQSEAMFSHMNYFADMGVDFISVSSNFEGFGRLAVSIKNISVGDIPITTETSPDGTGEIFSPRFSTFGITYANALTDRIGIGVTTEIITEQLDRASATSIAFSFGVQYQAFANIRGLDFGLVVKNLGPPMQYDGPGMLRTGNVENTARPNSLYRLTSSKSELPSTIEIGVGYQSIVSDQIKFNLTTIFQNQNFSDDEFKFGGELAYDESFFLRGGYMLSQETVVDSYHYGATLGAGITQNLDGIDFTFDYAYQQMDIFDGNHVFSIKMGF